MQVLKQGMLLNGGIAQAFYKEIPTDIFLKARNMLPEEFFLTIIYEFNRVHLIDDIINWLFRANVPTAC